MSSPDPALVANYNDYLPDDLADLFGPGDASATQASHAHPDGLGIDDEVAVAKRVREPRVKLDEGRLLSAKGIPALRKRAKVLKLKGKGHEFSDTARLLSLYQLWLDDLFPKARFGDALAMVEKAGHKAVLHKARMEWIDEAKPELRRDPDAEWDWRAEGGEDEGMPDLPAVVDAGGDAEGGDGHEREGAGSGADAGAGPSTTGAADNGRTSVPAPRDDSVPDDDLLDLLQSPPRTASLQHRPAPMAPPDEPDVPDDDILEALMAEAGA